MRLGTRIGFMVLTLALASGCAHDPPKGFILPPALSEVFRGGQMKGLEDATSADLGIPNQYDRVSHVCTSQPIFDLNGYYVKTSVVCY